MTGHRDCGGLALGGLTVVFLAAMTQADEVAIPLNQLPKAVAESARSKFPGAKWTEAARETEDGKTSYEVSMTHQGRKMDVTFQPDGTLLLVETQIPEKELPEGVLKAIKDTYPGATVALAESVSKGEKVKASADYYELHLKTANDKSVEIEVDATGKIMKSESGDEDSDKE